MDDLFAALPSVGLQLWLLADNGSEGWYCVLNDVGHPAAQHHGNGETAIAALAGALEDAGVKVNG